LEYLILPELLSDNLSDALEDIFNDSESESDDSVREKKLNGQNKITVNVKQASRKVTIPQMRGQPRG
jgi:peptidyl-tRNA hydrolase